MTLIGSSVPSRSAFVVTDSEGPTRPIARPCSVLQPLLDKVSGTLTDRRTIVHTIEMQIGAVELRGVLKEAGPFGDPVGSRRTKLPEWGYISGSRGVDRARCAAARFSHAG